MGGKVHKAWPRSGKPPRSALARWLARQVGPTKVRACTKRVHGKVVKCHRKNPPRRGAPLPGGQLGGSKAHTAAAAAAFMRLGEDINPIAYAASSSTPTPTGSTGTANLQLVRSYAIPTDDPSYTRLLNWSWTYDSAMTAAGFTVFGATSEAQQLLDQLAALQHTNGSIEIAFNVADGTTESVFRSGTIATVGLAGSLYDQRTHTNRYLSMEQRAASYLISLQGTTGLIRGGPDVTWYSTQHNLLAYAFLNNLGNELVSDGQRSTANTYFSAANKIASGIESKLLVQNGSQAWFIEGLGDNVQSLDADALGVLYLIGKGETTNAQKVLAYTNSAFAISGRSITKSTSTGHLQQHLRRARSVLRVQAVHRHRRPRRHVDRGLRGDGAGRRGRRDELDRARHLAAGHRGADADERPPDGRPHGHQPHLQRGVPRVAVGRRRRVAHPGRGAPEAVPLADLVPRH